MENYEVCICEYCGDEILYTSDDIHLGGDYSTGQLAPYIICPNCGEEITIGYARI